MATLAAEYGVENDMTSLPRLMAAHGVTFSAGPPH